jgi:hypothetical protein
MDEITLYTIKFSGEVEIQGASSADALTKAKEWFLANINKLNYSWTVKKAYIDEREE